MKCDVTATDDTATNGVCARTWAGFVTRILSAVFAASFVTGCTSMNPGSGPTDTAILSGGSDSTIPEFVEGYKLIDLGASNVGFYKVERVVDAPGGAGAETQSRVRLAPGDTMRIVISEGKEGGLFAPLSAAGGTNFSNVRVDSSGAISLPYVGRIPVRGLDTPEVEKRVRTRLEGVAVEPQVYVELLFNRNNSVLITGNVKVPARVSMLDGPMTVIDAVARAGGLSLSSLHCDAVIRHGSSVRRIPMQQVQNGSNPSLSAGDTLTIEANSRSFNAIGAVKLTGQIEFNRPNPSLMDGLTQAQWLNDDAANSSGVFIFRANEPFAYVDATGKWKAGDVIFRLDMRKPQNLFVAQAFALRPNDTIYVTTAPAYEWIKLIKPLALTMTTLRTTALLNGGL